MPLPDKPHGLSHAELITLGWITSGNASFSALWMVVRRTLKTGTLLCMAVVACLGLIAGVLSINALVSSPHDPMQWLRFITWVVISALAACYAMNVLSLQIDRAIMASRDGTDHQ